MKKPNPIFLGVIALAALLPHTPGLLPSPKVAPANELQPVTEMPTAELPGAASDSTGCAGSDHTDYQNENWREPGDISADKPAVDDQNCDTRWNPSPQNSLSMHLASSPAL